VRFGYDYIQHFLLLDLGPTARWTFVIFGGKTLWKKNNTFFSEITFPNSATSSGSPKIYTKILNSAIYHFLQKFLSEFHSHMAQGWHFWNAFSYPKIHLLLSQSTPAEPMNPIKIYNFGGKPLTYQIFSKNKMKFVSHMAHGWHFLRQTDFLGRRMRK